jgi:hypothetical protein
MVMSGFAASPMRSLKRSPMLCARSAVDRPTAGTSPTTGRDWCFLASNLAALGNPLALARIKGSERIFGGQTINVVIICHWPSQPLGRVD